VNAPCLESLEARQLLSNVLLPGQTAYLDINGDFVNEGVLVNNGPVSVNYDQAGALAVNLTADGAKFITNLPATVTGDFLLDVAKVGVPVRYRNVLYPAVAGDTTATAAAVNRFEVGVGDLAATTTVGGIGGLVLHGGDLDAVSSAGAIGDIRVKGDILGGVSAVGDIGLVSAERLAGSVDATGQIVKLAVDEVTGQVRAAAIGDLLAGAITGGAVTVGGSVGKLWADTIGGAAYIDVDGSVQLLRANTISPGENLGLWIDIQGDLAKLQVGRLDGSQAVGELAIAATNLFVGGSIGVFDAGLISAGTATGPGSEAFLQISVGVDVGRLRAGAIAGGQSSDGGTTWLMFDIGHDLIAARVGEITGSAADTPGTISSVQITVGNNVCDLAAGIIYGGTAIAEGPGAGASAFVAIRAYGNITELTAVRIDGGTAIAEEGQYAYAEVFIYTAGTIDYMRVNEITAGDGGLVTIWAEGDITSLVVNRIVLTADGDISIVAGGDMTIDVKQVRDWSLVGADGLQISAGGAVTDVRGNLGEFIDPVEVADPV
jgi:hypothetical protein